MRHLICILWWILVVWVHAWSWSSVGLLAIVGRAGLGLFWSGSRLGVARVASHVLVHAVETALADGCRWGWISCLRALYYSSARRIQHLVCDVFEGPIHRETSALNGLLCLILAYNLRLWHLSLIAHAASYWFRMLALSDLLLIFELHHIYARARHAQMAGAHADFRVTYLQTLAPVCDIGWINIFILLRPYLSVAPIARAPAPYSFKHLLLLSNTRAYIVYYIADCTTPRPSWCRWDARHRPVGSLLSIWLPYSFAFRDCRPPVIITHLSTLARALMGNNCLILATFH